LAAKGLSNNTTKYGEPFFDTSLYISAIYKVQGISNYPRLLKEIFNQNSLQKITNIRAGMMLCQRYFLTKSIKDFHRK